MNNTTQKSHSPTPWNGDEKYWDIIKLGNGERLSLRRLTDCDNLNLNQVKIERNHIIHCVNSHDALVNQRDLLLEASHKILAHIDYPRPEITIDEDNRSIIKAVLKFKNLISQIESEKLK